MTYQTRSFGRRRTPLAGSLDIVYNSHSYRNLHTSDANESRNDSITFPTGRGVIMQDSLSLGSVGHFMCQYKVGSSLVENERAPMPKRENPDYPL